MKHSYPQSTYEEKYDYYAFVLECGLYTIAKLKEIKDGYKAHEEEWLASDWAGSYMNGQKALHDLLEVKHANSVELPIKQAEKLKVMLKNMDIYYEPSSCGNLIHFEVRCTQAEAIVLNKFIDAMEEEQE